MKMTSDRRTTKRAVHSGERQNARREIQAGLDDMADDKRAKEREAIDEAFAAAGRACAPCDDM